MNLSNTSIFRLMTDAFNIPFEDCLPQIMHNLLSQYGQSIGTCVPFILMPLLPMVGVSMFNASVNTTSISMYSCIVAYPSSGKTAALQYLQRAFSKVEKQLHIAANNSSLTTAPTIEGVLAVLSKTPSLCVTYDEANVFFNGLRRNNPVDVYERSALLSLYNTPDSFERVFMRDERTRIQNPRFQIALLAHPHQVINYLQTDHTVASWDNLTIDLLMRFLIASPKPGNSDAFVMRNTPEPTVSLEAIFYLIHRIHANVERKYTFSNQAQLMIDEQFDVNRERVSFLCGIDLTLSNVFGKRTIQLERMCMLIKAFTQIAYCLLDVEGAGEQSKNFSNEFLASVEKFLLNMPTEMFIIEASIVEKTIKLLDYFTLNKLVLMGYRIDTAKSLSDILKKLIHDSLTGNALRDDLHHSYNYSEEELTSNSPNSAGFLDGDYDHNNYDDQDDSRDSQTTNSSPSIVTESTSPKSNKNKRKGSPNLPIRLE